MMRALVLALAASSVAAFVPAPSAPQRSVRVEAATDMEGISAPVGFFDPLGLSSYGSDETLAWFRAAELKHGRVAMAAFTGAWITGSGLHFPGAIDKAGTSFGAIGSGFKAWDAVPTAGKAQMLLVIGMIEFASESAKPHYMKGGVPGKIDTSGFVSVVKLWDPLGFVGGLTEEQKATKRLAELNNGRLAMIGVIGLAAAENVPGSVPAMTGFM